MRISVSLRTQAQSIPWENVLRPGRGIVYRLLEETAPELGKQLHSADGWQGTRLVPFTYNAPFFPQAPRQRGVYATGGPGYWRIASPAPEIAEALWTALHRPQESIPLLDWSGVALHITAVSALPDPDYSQGRARMRTATPVVLKGSGQDGAAHKNPRAAWLRPYHAEFAGALQANLDRKSRVLGLEPVALEAITWIGPLRGFTVGTSLPGHRAQKNGHCIEAELRGAPESLCALRNWGLGQDNTAGFGWVL